MYAYVHIYMFIHVYCLQLVFNPYVYTCVPIKSSLPNPENASVDPRSIAEVEALCLFMHFQQMACMMPCKTWEREIHKKGCNTLLHRAVTLIFFPLR